VTWGICTTNNRFKRSRIFDSKTKIKFHSRTGNTWFTPGIEVWSADRKFWIFFDSHGYERQLILIWNRGFGHVPTPAKHVLLVHMNMLQGLKIHEGLKINDVIIHKYFKCAHVNVNHGSLVGWATGCPYRRLWFDHLDENLFCIFLKNNSFRNLPQLSKRTCDYVSRNQYEFEYFPSSSRGIDRGTLGPPAIHTTLSTTDVVSWCWQRTKVLCIWSMFHRAILQQWKWIQLNEHWTTRVHKALPAKGIHENLKVCFSNISVQVEFTNWYQTSVCWNISILHYQGRNHPKSRVQVHP